MFKNQQGIDIAQGVQPTIASVWIKVLRHFVRAEHANCQLTSEQKKKKKKTFALAIHKRQMERGPFRCCFPFKMAVMLFYMDETEE